MRKVSFLLLVLTTLFTACKKNTVVQPPPDTAPAAAFTRTIDYYNQGSSKQASYDSAFDKEIRASISDGRIYLFFNAGARQPQTSGDAIVFQIDAAHLQSGLVKTYSLKEGQTPAVLFTRYTYNEMNADGSLWASFSDSGTGLRFEGYLTIEKWDAQRRQLSGSFKAEIKNLISDPTKPRTSSPIDPINYCNVTVTGTFNNVKLPAN